MPDARKAILRGTYEAARAHEALGSRDRWEREGGRIDVFGAIDQFGLPLMFQPLDGLLGAYLVKPSAGVLITTRRPLAIRRYTAAHELGHHRLGHEPSLDGEDLIARTPFVDRLGYDEREAEADAFATAFLLPIWFVNGQMRRNAWTPANMANASNVYQLAVRAGVSYEATCYALKNHRVISAEACAALVEIKPKTVKQSFVREFEPENWYLDVWHLEPRDDGLFVQASPGDLLDIVLTEHSDGGYLWDIAGIGQTDLELVSDRREPAGDAGTVGSHVFRRLVARAKSPGVGSVRFVERRPWERGTAPLTSFQFAYDVADVARGGLLKAQRDRLVGDAQ